MGYSRHSAPAILSRYVVDSNGCWIYQGEIGRYGYGIVTIGQRRDGNRRRWVAHRYFYTQLVAAVPQELVCCHKCDVRACVNPDHIFIGTPADNIADMMAKGRNGKTGVKGERHGRAKLTERQVLEIRASGEPRRVIAEGYKISIQLVDAIRARRVWRHI